MSIIFIFKSVNVDSVTPDESFSNLVHHHSYLQRVAVCHERQQGICDSSDLNVGKTYQ